MKKLARDKLAALGIDLRFDADSELAGYRRGAPLTMGDLRRLPDGAVVWVYVFYKRSVRANGAFRVERRGETWMLDDGSSFNASFEDEGGADEDPAADEWTTICAALKKDDP